VRWVIRVAEEQDHSTIVDIVRVAFSDSTRDGSEEVQIVTETWQRGAVADGLELVAIEEGRLAGHLLVGIGELDGREAPGVAPLAVVPDLQGIGIGTELMTEMLARAERAGWPMVLILGSPSYYGRFGFEPAGLLGITYPPIGIGDPHFMVRRFAGHDLSHQGVFTYCWEL
jgi:predicted N-acetyltransferase YhbS